MLTKEQREILDQEEQEAFESCCEKWDSLTVLLSILKQESDEE